MITLYGFPTCPYCNEMKTLLVNEGLEFKYVNIDLPENAEEFDKIMEVSKADEVPILKIGSHLLVPNQSFNTIEEGFQIAKKLLG